MQAEHSEKGATPPPFYAQTGPNAQPNGPSGYPPSFQSPTPTGPGMSNGPMHAMYAPQSTTTPMVTPGTMQVPPQQVAMAPGNLEAQVGNQFQSQLFARCARGEHDVVKKYGPFGIITAVLCFPIGLIALFIDVQRKCSRCGATLY